ncbi:DNA translocase FtsK [Brotaphodocola sp.]|uniref:DNA translocase FtsK n=1 Tax=Brotaphodocola sp. TaxID=3073577 RepID=UPI003D7C7E09
MASSKKMNSEEKSGKKTAPQTKKIERSTETRSRSRASSAKRGTSTPNRQTVRVAVQPEPEWQEEPDFVQSEACILLSLAVALLLFLSNLHVCGVAGEVARNIQIGVFGSFGFILPIALAGGVIFYSANQDNPLVTRKIVAGVILGVIICCFLQLFMGSEPGAGEGISVYYEKAVKSGVGGGMLGGLICMVFKKILGGLGTFVLLFVCMIITLVCITEKSFLRLVQEQGELAWEDFGRRREVQAERRQQRVRGVDLGATDLVSSKVSRGLRVYDGEKPESEEQREAYLEEKRAKSAGISLMMNETSGRKRQPTGGRNRRMPAQQPMYHRGGTLMEDLIVGVPLGAPAPAPAKFDVGDDEEPTEAKTISFAERQAQKSTEKNQKAKEASSETGAKSANADDAEGIERSGRTDRRDRSDSKQEMQSEGKMADQREKRASNFGSNLKISEPTITRPDPADIFTGSISHPQGYRVYTAQDEIYSQSEPKPASIPTASASAFGASQAFSSTSSTQVPMGTAQMPSEPSESSSTVPSMSKMSSQKSISPSFSGSLRQSEVPFEEEEKKEDYGTAVSWSLHASGAEQKQAEPLSASARYEEGEIPPIGSVADDDSSDDVWVNVTSRTSRPQTFSPASKSLRDTLASKSGKANANRESSSESSQNPVREPSMYEMYETGQEKLEQSMQSQDRYFPDPAPAQQVVRIHSTTQAHPTMQAQQAVQAQQSMEPTPWARATEPEYLDRDVRMKPTENGGSFAVPSAERRVVTASGKVIETETEALHKKLESKRQEELRQARAGQDTSVATQIRKEEELPKKEYVFPPTTLLKKGAPSANSFSDEEYRKTAIKLQQTLRNFGVGVTVTNISCGPSVTRYELHPEQGVKVSKIVALADDIKLSLAAADIRIEAPIPGKSAVGIEVPNKENNTVYLRDLLESENFRSHPSRLAFAVGKDIGGQVVVTDIAKMPHLLIAGATGSGKSVCINTLIMSVIFKSKPEDVKLIMIDPKVVELSVYNGIPHLLIPVVTDPKKASGALNWAVAEMTDRYKKFAQYNVRDLKGYNAKIESVKDIDDPNKPKKLPQIIIIVDELADLMMVAPGEVEDAICRLAQLARAAGIHLVIATQRPSVNVITGLIKANIPSRIAFSVSSGVDSRTIIDMNGAEKLLGKGDMLFYPAGFPKPQRVQGAFVSDQEVQAVVDFLTEQGMTADYSAEVETQMNSAPTAGAGGARDARDEYFAEAGNFIIEKDRASIGMLQRVFKIGFNRAARIMDQLAEAGVVGEEEGTKPRKVLMTQQEFEELLRQS